MRLWLEKPSRSERAKIRRLLAAEMSKLRTLVRKRIARALGVTGGTTDPFPRFTDPALWKTEIRIGNAQTLDGTTVGQEHRLHFVPCDEAARR
jgi:hypothetical protein